MRRVIVQILLVSFSFVFLNAQGTFKSNGIIALISDYGTKDFYTGALKGSILKINPQANVVDITHEITPFNIREGMFNLFLASQEYPKGTIFIASINSEGVISSRSILLETKDQNIFIAPDNGLLTLIINKYGIKQIREITNSEFFRKEGVSRTFIGRDILGPVAGYVSLGVDITQLGEEINDYELIPIKQPEVNKDKIIGEIIFIDRYGNIQVNFGSYFIKSLGVQIGEKIKIKIGNKVVKAMYSPSYGFVDEGGFVIFEASTDFIEIARNESSAEKYFNAKLGDRVEIEKIK